MKRKSDVKVAYDKAGRPTIPASAVGITLRISDEALARIKEIEAEQFRAIIECQDMVWD